MRSEAAKGMLEGRLVEYTQSHIYICGDTRPSNACLWYNRVTVNFNVTRHKCDAHACIASRLAQRYTQTMLFTYISTRSGYWSGADERVDFSGFYLPSYKVSCQV